MNSRKTALSFAAAGTAAGVIGLVLLATPAGAGEAPPALPPVSAESLVQSVLNTQVPAFTGSVEVQNHLGLPIPGIPASPSNGKAAEVWADGSGKARLAVPGRQSEMTIVDDGATVWVWNSENRTVTKVPHEKNASQKPLEGMFADPAKAAAQLVTAMQQDSTVTVDGTARVADRPVYQLVLTPKPTEKTLLREIRVSIDSELRIPMSVEVLANGQADPAVKIGFTDFTHAAQDPKLFAFTPPAGATVSEEKVQDQIHGQNLEDWLGQVDMKTVGRGWDIVATGRIPADLMNAAGDQSGQNLTGLLGTFGKEVHGSFGTGYVISAGVGTALITEDGKVAVGAVPQQVVIEAVKTVK